LIGAVGGWAMEQQWGLSLVRWTRIQRMRIRVARRQGEKPLSFWKQD
jgi:hypothetical protein